MSKHTPWRFSSYEGGWDCIRDARGDVILKPATTMNEPEMFQAIDAVNAHDDLLKTCQWALPLLKKLFEQPDWQKAMAALNMTAEPNLSEGLAALARATADHPPASRSPEGEGS